MLFNSTAFLLFFPIVVVIYYLLPKQQWRVLFLLLASYYFYMSWHPAYILLIVGSTLVDYWASLQMAKKAVQKERLPWLILSLSVNLGILFFFKYFNFFLDNINFLTGGELAYLQFLLPVGISFYTFQTLSYSIDVYQNRLAPEKDLGRFALYVSFFPQLVAGPIERSTRLLPQFRKKIALSYENFSQGGQRIIWGFFKKVVIADNLAQIVDVVYTNPGDYHSLALLLATYCFTIQIYCDFSGYSDIAIGTARILGIDLMENFKVPYFATSIRNFWQRWHISLSTWFRDYVYLPLGGNRVPVRRWYANLLIVFIVSGFWHGANWTFIIWGALHGLYLIGEIVLKKVNLPSLFSNRLLQTLICFHLVVLGWIFFRAQNLSEALYIIREISVCNFDLLSLKSLVGHFDGAGRFLFLMGLLLSFFPLDYWVHHYLQNQQASLSRYLRIGVYSGLVAMIVLFGYWGEVAFIYFQF